MPALYPTLSWPSNPNQLQNSKITSKLLEPHAETRHHKPMLDAFSQEIKIGIGLVAMPTMSDPRFLKSLILICAHNDKGTMGLIVNHISDQVTSEMLFKQFPNNSEPRIEVPAFPIYTGGPLAPNNGIILHSSEYESSNETEIICTGLSITRTQTILQDIQTGIGPQKFLVALGHAGWAPGQLEAEIQNNGWLVVEIDHKTVFETTSAAEKWARALKKSGIEPGMLSPHTGNA